MSQGNNEGERGIIKRFGTLGKVMERLWMLLNFRKGHDQGLVMKGCHPAETRRSGEGSHVMRRRRIRENGIQMNREERKREMIGNPP